jgi:DUF4097 and DUF4098 domain-containing protein YvlB
MSMTTTLVRGAGVLVLIAATTTALTGCAGVLGAQMTYDDTVQAKITEIVLGGGSEGSGDVRISTAAVDETTIKRIVRRSSNPGESYRVTGTSLNIDTSCGDNCSVTYEIQAPAGVAVRGALRSGDVALDGTGTTDLTLTSGDVVVRNAAGPVQLHATSGDIQVLDAKNSVKVESTSGDIKAINVAGAVDLAVTSGDITAQLTAANSVTAKATSGDVNVIVPPGDYRIATHTGSGDAGVHGVTSDPSARNVIDVRTGSGDVNVSAAA